MFRKPSLRRRALPTLSALLLSAASLHAQVAITPPMVFLGRAGQFGNFTVSNGSQTAQEVTIDFRFGYLRSDSLGNSAMQYDDSVAAARFSMASWIRAFPRRFLLQPGHQQVVRLMARPPANLPDGTYWTRLITASVPQSPSVDSLRNGVRTQIIVRMEQITTVFYRRGAASTGIQVGSLSTLSDSTGLHLLIPLMRTGNAPFIGSVTVRVQDENGKVVHEAQLPTSVYFSLVERVALPRAELHPGRYTATVRVAAERPDIQRDQLLPITPVAATTTFTVPATSAVAGR